MSSSKINPDLLYEALGREIADIKHAKAEQNEILKKTKQEYDQLLLKINENMVRLEEMYGKPVSVDIGEIRGEHERIKETLKDGMYFSTGLVISFFVLILGLGISLCCNYEQYKTNRKHYRWLLEARREFDKLKNPPSKSIGKK